MNHFYRLCLLELLSLEICCSGCELSEELPQERAGARREMLPWDGSGGSTTRRRGWLLLPERRGFLLWLIAKLVHFSL